VFKPQFGGDFSGVVQDQHIVMVLSPVNINITNTVVNLKSKDILRDFVGTPASRLARRNGTNTPGLNNAIA
jgi:hypothetical protein